MKRIVLLVLMVVMLVGVSLFIKKETKQPPVKEQKVTVLLDWFPNTNHTGLYVSLDKGYFAAEGLEVKIIQPSEGEATTLVAAGKADFAVSSQEAVTLARVKNVPVVSIAAIMQHNTSAFASLAKENIKSPKDFEGKRYGGWGSPIENATIQAVMEEAGDYSQVKNITIGTSDFFTTIGRDSDFQWIFYGWDGIEAKRRKIALNTIMLKDLNPVLDYYTPVLLTNEQHIRQQKELTAAFMRATVKGYAFAIQNPTESANILLKHAPELNKDLVQQSQVYLSAQYQADAKQWGIEKNEVWKRYADWLYGHQLMEKNIDTRKAFTNEFLPEVK